MEVSQFSNKNKITDYLTSADEVTLRFGVGKLIAYQYSDFFELDQVIEVPAGKISFPCFKEEAFYFYLTENDEF